MCGVFEREHSVKVEPPFEHANPFRRKTYHDRLRCNPLRRRFYLLFKTILLKIDQGFVVSRQLGLDSSILLFGASLQSVRVDQRVS